MRDLLPTAGAPRSARLLVLVAVAGTTWTCERSRAPETPAAGLPTVTLTVGGHPVTAEVVDDPDLRARGLMERAALQPDHGMIFVYPDEQVRSFWMKNTILPLSIAFMDAGGRIVHTADMEPLDLTAVPSQRPAMYALEMQQGWFAAHQVGPGQKVEGLPPPSAR